MVKLEKSMPQSNYFDLVEKYRGHIEVNKQLQLLALIAVLARANPKAFEELYASTKPDLRLTLERVVNDHLLTMMLASFVREAIEIMPEDLIQEVVYFVSANKNFELLSALIHNTYLAQRGAYRHESSTSEILAKILIKLAGEVSGKVVYDGAAGLCVATSKMASARLVLEDVNMESSALGESVMFLKGITHEYYCNDALLKPRASVQADVVVSQPPFGLRLASEQLSLLSDSVILQFGLGESLPRSASDALWIQQALYHTNSSGRVLMILPQGWMFRGGYDAQLREYLIGHDLLESVISLRGGLLANTNISSSIIILNKDKDATNKGLVRFVDASHLFSDTQNDKQTQKEIELLFNVVNSPTKKSDFLKKATLPEIYQNKCDLSVKRYITLVEDEEEEDLEQELERLLHITRDFEQAKKRYDMAMEIKS